MGWSWFKRNESMGNKREVLWMMKWLCSRTVCLRATRF